MITAVELGVFDALQTGEAGGGGPSTCRELAMRLAQRRPGQAPLSLDGLERLLDALVSLQLLSKHLASQQQGEERCAGHWAYMFLECPCLFSMP